MTQIIIGISARNTSALTETQTTGIGEAAADTDFTNSFVHPTGCRPTIQPGSEDSKVQTTFEGTQKAKNLGNNAIRNFELEDLIDPG